MIRDTKGILPSDMGAYHEQVMGALLGRVQEGQLVMLARPFWGDLSEMAALEMKRRESL